jgi:hypothetical protein
VRFFVGCGLACSLALVSCAGQPQGLWLKPGATKEDFNKERYACMQQAQQPNSVAYLDKYGGVSNSKVITNENLFSACMNAGGWYLAHMQDPKVFNESVDVEVARLVQLCSQADLQPIFPRKMACKPKDTTPEQLSDRSKISESERVALTKWRSAVEETNQRIAAIDRQYAGRAGEVMASGLERSTSATSQLSSQLYDGRISWGEFNKGRIDIAHRVEAEAKDLIHN